MRNIRVVPIATISAVAVVLLILGWHHDQAISSVMVDIGSKIKGAGTPTTTGETTSKVASKVADPTATSLSTASMDSALDSAQTTASNAHMPFTMEEFDHEHLGYQTWVYTRSGYRLALRGSVLVATSIANENSFGKGRSFQDFYDVIDTMEYPKGSMTLAFYCGSSALLESMKAFFDDKTRDGIFPYSKVTLMYAPFLQSKFKSSDHKPSHQRLRRRSIAKGRNFVTANGLAEEQYLLFLDADIVKFDQTEMLQVFIDSDKDIIVPRVGRGKSTDYDRNSWRGHRTVPTAEQFALMDEGKWDEANYVPMDVKTEMYHLGGHLKEIKDLPETDPMRDLSYAVDLDSVGGAVLFSKSIIFKQGVVFPTLNIVGTSWDRTEGFDGIETEGVCYMAQSLGYKCYAMPNLVAQHFDY